MLLKVSYLLLGYLLVDGYFLDTYAANVSMTFDMRQRNDGTCVVEVVGGAVINNTLVVNEGDQMTLTFLNGKFMNNVTCNASFDGYQFNRKIVYLADSRSCANNQDRKIHIIYKISNATHGGMWRCEILTLRGVDGYPNQVQRGNQRYTLHKCFVNVSVERVKNETDVDLVPSGIPFLWIYVGIGIIVAVVIIAQTAVILYLKSKAKRTARLDELSLRANDRDKSDTKRYSLPPGVKKSRFSRILRRNGNNDETIYETLEEMRNAGEQTPPVPPIETIPTLKKKQISQNQGSSEVMSNSLPRPDKVRSTLPGSANLHRIPEREQSPEFDIGRRPPLPLPTELPEERTTTPSRQQRTPFSPIEEAGHSRPTTLTRPRLGIGQASMTSELNNILKMRKASLATPSANKPPSAPPKKHSFPSLKRKPNKEVASDLGDTEQGKFVPVVPNPLPTGKSAILLGLAPGPTPKPKSHLKQFVNTPISPPKANMTLKTPLKTPLASNTPPVTSLKPLGSVMLPRPQTTSIAPNKPLNAPAKLPAAVILPKPVTIGKPGAAIKPRVAHNIPAKPMMTENSHHSKFQGRTPQFPTPSIRKPPTFPPPHEPVQEAVYEESGEQFYNEDWTDQAPNPHPPWLEKQTPQFSTASMGKPPLPPPNKPTQEEVYEEYTDEPVYNSDEEWTYEPLQQYNIYSS